MAPQAFKAQVDDMDKRINILFDHLNNEDLLQPDTVQQMVQISQFVAEKQWDQAQASFAEMQSAKLDTEGTHWMVSLMLVARAKVIYCANRHRSASSASLILVELLKRSGGAVSKLLLLLLIVRVQSLQLQSSTIRGNE